MIEYYENLELEEQHDITEAIQMLLRQTFLLERKYDKHVGRFQFNKRYRVCYKHFTFIKEYLKVSGIELLENSQTGVIYIRGEQVLGERMSKLTTIYILILKLIYDEQMAAISTSEQIYTTLSDLNERIGNYGLLKNKPTMTEIKKSISLMRKYQIIDTFDPMDEFRADSRLIIYPSINLVLFGEDAKAYLEDISDEVVVTNEEELFDGAEYDDSDDGEEELFDESGDSDGETDNE